MKHKYVERDYQIKAIESVFNEFKTVSSTLMVMATGTGKTEIYLKVAERFLEENPGLRVLVVAHREELISQPLKRWRRNREEWPVVEMGELKAEATYEADMFDSSPTNPCILMASVQTLNSGRRCRNCTSDCEDCDAKGKSQIECEECNGDGYLSGSEWDADSVSCDTCRATGKVTKKCKECDGDGWICIEDDCPVCFEHWTRRMQKFEPEHFGLIIIDEAHHSVADTYTRIIRYFRHRNPDVKILGCTATPDRADESALGQIYESVAFEYNLPQPIIDGWLTPIDQQFIMVEDLNLANVRTTAGDFNAADLEREMLAEKVLHKITTPLIEIACGLERGTIDRLIREGTLEALPILCTKSEPTLIHAVDVAHAERMTEIINRYLPDSALCIIGTTDKTIRREGLKRFEEGKYQFLLSCGVFLEGTDLPNVSIIGMARPTKSRALYSQMLGRGLRALSGLLDRILYPEERVKLIAESAKPKCLVIDFVGNSGRHKLISSLDILGNELPDELVNGVIRKAARDGKPIDSLRALAEAKEREERERHEQARREAKAREEQQLEAQRRAEKRRSGIVAGASYTTQQVNPFDVMDIQAKREPGWHKGRKPSDKMKEVLTKNGVPFNDNTTFWEAHLLIDEIFERRKKGLCTFRQAKWLREHGYSPDLKFEECSRIMTAWKNNGWRRPEGMQ